MMTIVFSHIKIAWVNLKAHRLFSMINILGLSLGLAICILLYLFVSYEQSFDSMHENESRIYRVLLHTEKEGIDEVWCNVPAALAPEMEANIPAVKAVTRLLKHNYGEDAYISAGQNNFIEKSLYWADSEILEIFDIKLLKGNIATALQKPNTVILSENISKKYFGEQNPIGEHLKVDNEKELEIVGVFEDFPGNSTLDCNIIASFKSTGFYKNPKWYNASFETYCLLNENSEPVLVQDQLQKVLDKNVDRNDQWYSFSLQALSDIHLYSSSFQMAYSSRIGDIKEVRNLSLLAILILIIACINYMNLTTAQSQKRAKDVGLNKTLGASTGNLVLRFYVETGLIVFVSLLLGLFLAVSFVPVFNHLTTQNLQIELLNNSRVLAGLFFIWLITTVISGSYPAFYLSRFMPNTILNPTFKHNSIIIYIRKTLVILQFVISVVLIVAVLVIHFQIEFMQTRDLGFNSEDVIIVSNARNGNTGHLEVLLEEYKSHPNVLATCLAQGYPGVTVSERTLLHNNEDQHGINIHTNSVDAAIFDVLKLELIAGRMPKKSDRKTTRVEVVINEKALEYLSYKPEEVIGKKVSMQLGEESYVVGVVKNFNFSSLHQTIGAYAFHNCATFESKPNLMIRVKSGSINEMIPVIKEIYHDQIKDSAFDYSILSQNVEQLYTREKQTSRISLIFCGLAILLVCLGLFALSAFSTEQRTKEIGIRKVNGASTISIIKTLVTDFLRLVLWALLLAYPIAFLIMNKWLQTFAYKIVLSWWYFIVSGLLALLVLLLTVSWQSFQAARKNPIEALRYE